MNTTSVVSEDARMGAQTSSVASRATVTGLALDSRPWRTMFSITTTALSTTMPAANARPASEITFKDRSNAARRVNVPTRHSGMVSPMASVETTERRKRNRTRVAARAPIRRLIETRAIASQM